jgi:two-component system NtrC family response regulator
VLQERRFRPLGGKTELKSDFRLIAATNRNLDEMVQDGRFRKDLLFRIRALVIELPPLRERPEDIKDLIIYHVAKTCEYYGIGMKGFSPEFFDVLATYDWPGNVRELVNATEATLLAARDEPTLFPRHLPPDIRVHAAQALLNHSEKSSDERAESSPGGARKAMPPLKKFLDSAKRRYLTDLMAFTEGDIQLSCDISGMSRAGLYAHLKKYKIS